MEVDDKKGGVQSSASLEENEEMEVDDNESGKILYRH